MSNTQSQQFKFTEAVISADRLFRTKFDVRTQIAELNIFETLDKPYLTGQIVINDDKGVFDKINFQGTERIKITCATVDKSLTPVFEREFIMSGIETKNYKAGEIIYSINDAADKIYLIHNGTVRVKSKLGLNLAVLKEGEMFGEVGPIIEEPRTVTVIAETNCTLREIEHSTLHKKLEGADPVLVGIIRGLALRIGDANKLAEQYWQELSVYKSLE